MAAKCVLNKKGQTKDLKKALEPLQNDQAKVYVMSFGCIASLQTVSEVLGELQKDPEFLGDLKEEPNQPLEPTAPFARLGSP